jgi:predicted phosphodiesterase
VRYAILSDVHSRYEKLEAVLADAMQRNASHFISLGDVGSERCLALLRRVGALAVFGNYEVSGWRRFTPTYRAWVQRWPPLLTEDGFLAVHAAPWWPEGLKNIQDFEAWLKRTRRSWRALFPYLTGGEDQLWRALSHLEIAGRSLLFHGHTHRQAVWRWRPSGSLERMRSATASIEPDCRYVVGVGSVGLPEDDSWAAYTLYDAAAACIEQITVKPRRRACSPGS